MGGRLRDCWAEWLAERRFGGDHEVRERFLAELQKTRDKVLDNAQLAHGETLLDVGCGDGLIAFGALERGAGNPRIPTLAEVMEQVLSADERDLYEAHLRPLVETGTGRRRMASAFLWARKTC
jgi:predicted TPR repeat methyltransferase